MYQVSFQLYLSSSRLICLLFQPPSLPTPGAHCHTGSCLLLNIATYQGLIVDSDVLLSPPVLGHLLTPMHKTSGTLG